MKNIAIIILFATSLFAQQRGGFDMRGSFYSDLSALHFYDSDGKDSLGFSGMSTLAINAKNRNRSSAKVDMALEIKMPYGTFGERSLPDDSTSAAGPVLSDYLLASLDGSMILIDLRRLYGELYFDNFELSIGRQNIGFGVGSIFSPVDKFSQVEFSDFRFRRSGSDVVHLFVPIGNMWGVTATAELPYGDREHSSAMKLFGTVGSFDIAATTTYRHKSEAVLPGFTFKGDAFVGLYGEGVLVVNDDSSDTFFDGMFGVDYSIASKWLFLSEYQYLGRDSKHSIMGGATYSINELLSTSAYVIQAITDTTTMGTAQITWNALQNADITAFVRGYLNDPYSAGDSAHDLDYSLRVTVKF